MRTVRDAAFETMRRFGLTTIFGNPGSTEIPFLTDLPDDIRFVLGLHEGSVVGIATGYALARGEPAFVNLHTAPGLGNAINAIVNARDVRAPLIVVVGQQDRRQLALEPFLTGRQLERLAGEYPVWSNLPARAQDVPGAIARAYNEAMLASGPALVVVPMGDWLEPADEYASAGSPAQMLWPCSVSPDDVAELASMIAEARSPALVVGAGSDSVDGWLAVTALAQRLRCPVWQESFVRRAGFPQDHPLFAGILPWRRQAMRQTLAPHDLVVAVGAAAFRLYILDEPGPFVEPGTLVAVVTDNPAEALRSPCELALVAPVADACRALADAVPARDGSAPEPMRRPPHLDPPPSPDAPAASRPCLRRARAADAARRDHRRGDPVEPTRALPATPDHGSGRLLRRRQRRPRLRPGRLDRPAHGRSRAARDRHRRRRVLDVRDPVAVERRAVPRRRAADRDVQRPLRGHGPPRARRRAARARGPRSMASTSRASPSGWAVRPGGSRATTS